MSPGQRRYGEEDQEHYERPRRHTRPRTKERPSYDDASDGLVLAVDRGRFGLLVDGQAVTAMKARPLGRKGVVVGDRVRVVGDVSGDDGSLARIVEVADRSTVLRRSADDDDAVERVLVSNADQLVDRERPRRPRAPHRADRPRAGGGVRRRHEAPALPHQVGPRRPRDAAGDVPAARGAVGGHPQGRRPVASLRDRLDGRTSVLLGHSGVGKSTLVNALVPDADREIGHVNAVTGRGRHTSTSAIMLPLPDDGGWIIDTPGIRSFGLAHVQPEHLIEAFPDLDEMTEDCPRGCTHGTDEPECGLDEAVERGDADPVRVESFRRLLAARSLPVY